MTPFPATKHGLKELVVDGKTVSPFHVQSATAPFSLTGMPALSMRFGTSHDGLPIGVQIVSSWLAELTVLDVALRLENVSPVRDLHPTLDEVAGARPPASKELEIGFGVLKSKRLESRASGSPIIEIAWHSDERTQRKEGLQEQTSGE